MNSTTFFRFDALIDQRRVVGPCPLAIATAWGSQRSADHAFSRAVGYVSVPTWKSQVGTILERNKRYPAEERDHCEQGVVQLAFCIDRQGHVVSSRIFASPGPAAHDEETLPLCSVRNRSRRRRRNFPARRSALPSRFDTIFAEADVAASARTSKRDDKISLESGPAAITAICAFVNREISHLVNP